ncbi:hypothetical protein F5B17DRAFT_453980 [Nemania serpens]|nr:hypothetical protein F5B17DRAFT_453980 [Nemania serpens]
MQKTAGLKEAVVGNSSQCEKHRLQKSNWSRSLYAKRTALGLCTRCGSDKVGATGKVCANCVAGIKQRRDERRDAENVILSQHPEIGGHRKDEKPYYTEAEQEHRREYNSGLRGRRLAAGLCERCGRCPPEGQWQTCASCLERRRQLTRISKAKRSKQVMEAAAMIFELDPDILNTSETDSQRPKKGRGSLGAYASSTRVCDPIEQAPEPDASSLADAESLAMAEMLLSMRRQVL